MTTQNPPDLPDQFVEWAHRNPHATARVRHGGRWHVGIISVTTTHRPDGTARTVVRVRDNTRGARSQYQLVTPRAVESGDLQVKVGARYQPWQPQFDEGADR
jgi:hypothetical protein